MCTGAYEPRFTGLMRSWCVSCTHSTTRVVNPCSLQGVACDLTSDSFKYLNEATTEVLGESNPFSLCGSIPCVGDMKEAGFDLQVKESADYIGNTPPDEYNIVYSISMDKVVFFVVKLWK